MKKLKRILVSLILSLIVIVIFWLIYNAYTNQNLSTVYILKEDVSKGTKILPTNIMCVQIKGSKKDFQNTVDYATLENITSMYTSLSIKSGTIIKHSDLSVEPGILEDEEFEYIAIPFENPEDVMGYFNISKGSRVNLYFSARRSDVNNILGQLKDKVVVYNSDGKEAVVTACLYNDIEVVETLDMDGQRAIDTKITELVFKIPKSDAVLLSNLKVYSTFCITLIE